ncbi:CAP domain-containing protein [Robinsoniella peoriensis]|uniref:CAP domain-containing protein n=1 Tax=Robinsoniella peoriensis TaxID=180332 RepID=UPI000694DD52|nr:CAP domain-containing protein [Robinsoniella peoriensis]
MLSALLATAIIGAPVMDMDAGKLNAALEQAKANGCAIVQQIDISNSDIKAELEKLGINISEITNCPDINNPETETPETNAPETNAPETEAPETNAPETNVPETNAPETEAPETNVPETNAPETNAPETNAPETDGSQDVSAARKVADLVNQERAKAGLAPLEVKVNLQTAAQLRAKEIEKSFSHTRPNGSSFSTVLSENGVDYRGSGENIAWGQRSPEEVMNGWMNSDGHRANILNKNFKYIGVGYHVNSNGTGYWTQLFTY